MAPPHPDELLIDDLPGEYEEIIAGYPAEDDEIDVSRSWQLPGKWVNQAFCNPELAELFWPAGGPRAKPEYVVRLCQRRCPVQRECLDYAIENDEEDGIWGGMNYPQRLAEKARRERKARREIA